MTTTTNNIVRSLLPDDVNVPENFVEALTDASVALQVANVIVPDNPSHTVRLPLVTQTPTATWLGEGDEIPTSDAEVGEAVAEYHKLGTLLPFSREGIVDADPRTLDLILSEVARDIALQVDRAFFGTAPDNSDQLPGLGNTNATPYATTTPGWSDVDTFTLARHRSAAAGSALTAWVTNPEDAALLALIRESDTSRRPLLEPDPTRPDRATIGGLPLFITPAVEAGSVWGLSQSTAHIALRQDVSIEVSEHIYFSSDRVGVRALARVGTAFTNEPAIARIVTTTGE